MRPVARALALALAGCAAPRPAPTSDAPQPVAAQQTSAAPEAAAAPAPHEVAAALAALDAELAEAGEFGSRVGHLREKKGDLLASAGRRDEAIAAYEAAARAYGQSPEATNMPVINAERAQAKAEKLRSSP